MRLVRNMVQCQESLSEAGFQTLHGAGEQRRAIVLALRRLKRVSKAAVKALAEKTLVPTAKMARFK